MRAGISLYIGGGGQGGGVTVWHMRLWWCMVLEVMGDEVCLTGEVVSGVAESEGCAVVEENTTYVLHNPRINFITV